MDEQLEKVLRTLQTRFPWAADLKYEAQRLVRRLSRRPFEEDFRAIRVLDLGPTPLMVDVGANRGQSIDAFGLVSPGARIVAFEPSPLLSARLLKRYRRRANVTIHAVGLGDRPGEFALNVPHYNGYPFDGLASFDLSAAQEWLETRVLRFDPTKLRTVSYRCKVRTLDEFDLEPVVIKVDVQGFEEKVLRGAEETLRRARPVLLVESPDAPTRAFLAGLGYTPHAFRERRLWPGETGHLNTFFLHSRGRRAPGG